MYSATTGGLQDPDPDLLVVLNGYLDRGLTDYSAPNPANRTPTASNKCCGSGSPSTRPSVC